MGHGAVGVGACLPQAKLLTRGEKKRASSCTPVAPTDYVVIKDSVPSGKFIQHSGGVRCEKQELGSVLVVIFWRYKGDFLINTCVSWDH